MSDEDIKDKLEHMQENLRKANRSAYQRKKEAGMVRINFWIPGDLKKRFDQVAAKEPHKKEDLMIQAIEEFCDHKIERKENFTPEEKRPKIIRQAEVEAERPEDPNNKFCIECIQQHPTCNGCCELCTFFDDCEYRSHCLMPLIPIGKSIDEMCQNCDGFGCENCNNTGWTS